MERFIAVFRVIWIVVLAAVLINSLSKDSFHIFEFAIASVGSYILIVFVIPYVILGIMGSFGLGFGVIFNNLNFGRLSLLQKVLYTFLAVCTSFVFLYFAFQILKIFAVFLSLDYPRT